MTTERVWTVRSPWSGKLYGFEMRKFKACMVKARFKKREIPTVLRLEPLEGLYEELTADQ